MSGAPPPYTPLEEPKEPPPYGPQPGYQAQNTVILQPQITLIHQFKEVPCPIKCQYCGNEVVTSVLYDAGTLTWLTCFLLIFACPLLCFLPFFIAACQDVVHTCPNCHKIVGRYNRI